MKNISAVSDSKDIVTVEYIDNITASADASNAITINHSVSYPLLSLKAYGRSWQGERIVNVSDIDIEGYGIPVDTGGNYTDSNGQQWICDELVVNADGTGKIVKHTKSTVFDGSDDENWRLESNYNRIGTTILSDIVVKPETANVIAACLCTNLAVVSASKTFSGVQGFAVSNSGGAFICADELVGNTDISAWLLWLSQNPVTAVCALNATGETELTAEQITALQPVIDRYGAFTAYFMSAQDSTPTPENPVDIVSTADLHRGSVPIENIGDNEFTATACGKNLFDFKAWKNTVGIKGGTANYTDNSIKLTATEADCFTRGQGHSNYTAPTYQFKVKPNTQYTLSWTANNNEGMVYVFINGIINGAKSVDNKTAKQITFMTPDFASYILIRFGVRNSGESITYSNIQLEIGDTASEYEPYRSSSAEITTGLPLRGVPVSNGGNYTDVNGQEWVCDTIEYNYTSAVKRQRIAVINSYNGEAVGENYISTTGSLDVGSTVIYPAENVTETALTADEINQLRSLVTFDGVTNIYNSEDADMTVEYLISKAVSKAVMPIITALRSDVNA